MKIGEPLVVVIDDDESVCRALARMLSASGYRVRTHTRAEEYLQEADAIEPACILADIRMPGIDGIELARAMRAARGEAPIVFMTATGDVSTVVHAMKEGAIDLLPKPFSAEMLLHAIEHAIDAGRRNDDAHRSLVALWRLAGRLTPREAEVCALVACGSPNKNVAAQIGTTEKTVKVHRGRVMHKFGAPSLAELVRMVDRLIAEPDRTALHLDGVEIPRPVPVDIIIDAVGRSRRLRSEMPDALGFTPPVDPQASFLAGRRA
ncbi:MAG TPA: response regulator [Gemmatimonadaceae bacterium]|jgi:FixJ family two-component response regulator